MIRHVTLALLACSFFSLGAVAETVSSKSRTALFQSQKKLLDNRAASQYRNSVRLQPPSIVAPSKWDVETFSTTYDGPYLDVARNAARRHGIPEDLFLRLVQQESGWSATAESPKGALGLAQLMPDTARFLQVDPLDPEENLDGGARYLKIQFREFGDWRLALAAYNAGPGAVKKHGGIPPFAETIDYVRIIAGR